MSIEFKEEDFRNIGNILGVEPKFFSNTYRYEIQKDDPVRRISLEIYPNIPIGKKVGNLISLYSINSHLQLHFCSGYVASEILGEVTFYSECGGHISGMIIEKEGGCSLFSNVEKDVLSGDFTQLAPEVMMSSIALSLMETTLPDLSDEENK
jgi:hypothetical protein